MIDAVRNSFRTVYNKDSEFIVKAPGRINLIGEHTDYNSGLVLPAAIDKYMCFAFKANDSKVGQVYAKDLDEKFTIDLDVLKKTEIIWVNYLIGILLEFERKGIVIIGFECVFFSDIPIGAGMSSSAALECGFAVGMDHINQSRLSKWEIVEMSHLSNHSFMNIYGGIMDQFSLLFGQKDKCILLNCVDRSYSYHDMDLEDCKIVLINTNVKHEHTTSGYNERAAECKQIQERLIQFDARIKSISDADIDTIENIGREWPEHLKRRARFVINENHRVLHFTKAMKRRDVEKLGELLYQSHFGLQHLFEVSCLELDLLVDLTRSKKHVLGARMMGGGFGGCTINLIKSELAEKVTNDIKDEYYKETGIQAESYFVNISDGVRVIEL